MKKIYILEYFNTFKKRIGIIYVEDHGNVSGKKNPRLTTQIIAYDAINSLSEK